MLGLRFAAHTLDRHLIGGDLPNTHLAQVHDHIRRQVAGRVVHFVEQLFLDRAFGDATSGASRLADDDLPIGRDAGDGAADIGQVRYVLQAGMSEVATADLGAAFEQVANCRGLGDAIPVIGLPAEGMAQRPHRQAGVGDSAAEDDVGALIQRLDDAIGTAVDIDRDHFAVELRGQPLLQIDVAAEQVVAQYAGDACRFVACALQLLAQARGGGGGVGGAAVGDDGDAGVQAGLQHRFEKVEQAQGVAALGIVEAA